MSFARNLEYVRICVSTLKFGRIPTKKTSDTIKKKIDNKINEYKFTQWKEETKAFALLHTNQRNEFSDAVFVACCLASCINDADVNIIEIISPIERSYNKHYFVIVGDCKDIPKNKTVNASTFNTLDDTMIAIVIDIFSNDMIYLKNKFLSYINQNNPDSVQIRCFCTYTDEDAIQIATQAEMVNGLPPGKLTRVLKPFPYTESAEMVNDLPPGKLTKMLKALPSTELIETKQKTSSKKFWHDNKNKLKKDTPLFLNYQKILAPIKKSIPSELEECIHTYEQSLKSWLDKSIAIINTDSTNPLLENQIKTYRKFIASPNLDENSEKISKLMTLFEENCDLLKQQYDQLNVKVGEILIHKRTPAPTHEEQDEKKKENDIQKNFNLAKNHFEKIYQEFLQAESRLHLMYESTAKIYDKIEGKNLKAPSLLTLTHEKSDFRPRQLATQMNGYEPTLENINQIYRHSESIQKKSKDINDEQDRLKTLRDSYRKKEKEKPKEEKQIIKIKKQKPKHTKPKTTHKPVKLSFEKKPKNPDEKKIIIKEPVQQPPLQKSPTLVNHASIKRIKKAISLYYPNKDRLKQLDETTQLTHQEAIYFFLKMILLELALTQSPNKLKNQFRNNTLYLFDEIMERENFTIKDMLTAIDRYMVCIDPHTYENKPDITITSSSPILTCLFERLTDLTHEQKNLECARQEKHREKIELLTTFETSGTIDKSKGILTIDARQFMKNCIQYLKITHGIQSGDVHTQNLGILRLNPRDYRKTIEFRHPDQKRLG